MSSSRSDVVGRRSGLSLPQRIHSLGVVAAAPCRSCSSSGAVCVVADISVRCARCVRWHFGCSLSKNRRRELLLTARSFVHRRYAASSRRVAAASSVLSVASADLSFWDHWGERLRSPSSSRLAQLLPLLHESGFSMTPDPLEWATGGTPLTTAPSLGSSLPSPSLSSPVAPVDIPEGSVTNPSPPPAVESTPASSPSLFLEPAVPPVSSFSPITEFRVQPDVDPSSFLEEAGFDFDLFLVPESFAS